MATLQTLQALQDAIDQGVLEVEYSDKKVRYRSLDEMERIATKMKHELGLTKPANGRRVAQFRNGLTSHHNHFNDGYCE